MKIGIDIRTLMDAQYSGVPEYTYNLLSEIFKLDHSNEYRLFYNSAKDISARMPKFDQPNVKIIKTSYPNKILNYISFKIFGKPEIDKMLDIDIFFMPHINFIGLSSGARSVLTVHDLSFLRFPGYFSARKNFWHSMINVKNLARKATRIVAVSENTKKDIVELCGVPEVRIEVVYSGISNDFRRIDKTDPRMIEVKNKFVLPEKFILFLGTIEPRKNIDGLIEAYDKLREHGRFSDTKLVIAGGKGWKGGEIIGAWSKSPFKDDVLFLGFITGEEKTYLYNLASVFVYPSFYEGFGFPPLEAMACGTPVITSISSSIPEVVGEAALMVDPQNTSDLSRAIAGMLTDASLRSMMINKGLTRASLFGWPETARKYLDIFQSLR